MNPQTFDRFSTFWPPGPAWGPRWRRLGVWQTWQEVWLAKRKQMMRENSWTRNGILPVFSATVICWLCLVFFSLSVCRFFLFCTDCCLCHDRKRISVPNEREAFLDPSFSKNALLLLLLYVHLEIAQSNDSRRRSSLELRRTFVRIYKRSSNLLIKDSMASGPRLWTDPNDTYMV